MLNLIDLKSHILNHLNKEKINFSEQLKKKKAYLTLSFTIMPSEFLKLFNHTSSTQKCFFKDKDQNLQILGLGAKESFNRKSSYSSMIDLVNEKGNENLLILGGQSFGHLGTSSKEWEGFGECYFFIPLVFFMKKENKYTFNVNINIRDLKDNESWMSLLMSIEDSLTFKVSESQENKVISKSLIPKRGIWNSSLAKCIERLKEKEIEKVVLARKAVINFLHTPSMNDLTQVLDDNDNSSFSFILCPCPGKLFVSMTPERLFKKSGNTISVDCIAGTRRRGRNDKEDKKLERELLTSFKELREHQLVAVEIGEKLYDLCDLIKQSKKEEVLKLKNLQHISGEFQGQLKKNTNFAQIINTLHPTPAVGGRPWNKAISFIKEYEEFDRGFYAAPVGYITKKESQFAVGIRSALISGNEVHLFAGAGIVEDSTPEKEWEEIGVKLKNFEGYLSESPAY